VEITKPFYLAKYPVTQEQYLAITGVNPSHFSKDGKGADTVEDLDTRQFPVEMVSWDDAHVFCKKLAENDKQKRRFRLPTEVEWEYACRAGTTTPFYFGSELNGKQANCNGNVPYGTTDKGPYKERTTKVGEYGENQWGLCDMLGNVYQLCEDYYGPYEGLNPKDPLRTQKHSEDQRVMRGGSWRDSAAFCRGAFRVRFAASGRNSSWGFRVAFHLD
jgi:formylglycine-generating enzyme required for sulfatase activity